MKKAGGGAIIHIASVEAHIPKGVCAVYAAGPEEREDLFQEIVMQLWRAWPSFRGEYASGIAENQNLPDKWNGQTGENIKWKTKIPGLAHACPIIWGDKLFVTSAISSNFTFYLHLSCEFRNSTIISM